MATSQPARPARKPVRDTHRGMAWGEKLHSPAMPFVRALAQAERSNGPGNWSLVEHAANDKSCPVNFPFDSRAARKRFARDANFLISLEV